MVQFGWTEYKNNGLEGSINIPLFMLRLKVATLAQDKKHILYCDTGRRSSAAAFLSTAGSSRIVIQPLQAKKRKLRIILLSFTAAHQTTLKTSSIKTTLSQ